MELAVLDPLSAPLPTVDGVPDTRVPERRNADAFMQLCQLATPALPKVRGERQRPRQNSRYRVRELDP